MVVVMQAEQQERPKIYIGVCGIGHGHIRRMLYFAREVRNFARILFSTYGDGIPPLRREGMRFVECPPIELEYGGPQIKIEPRLFLAKIPQKLFRFFLQILWEIRHIKMFRPDLVISDTRLSTIVAARILGVPSILVADQLHIIIPSRDEKLLPRWKLLLKRFAEQVIAIIMLKLWSLSNKIVIPDLPPPYDLSRDIHKFALRYIRRKLAFIGPMLSRRIRLSKVDNKDFLREKYDVPKNKVLVYILISGARYERALMIRAIKRLLQSKRSLDDMLEFIISLGNPKGTLRRRIGKNFQIWSWIPDNLEVIAISDVAVIMAGPMTMYEVLFFGKPIIAIPFPQHTQKEANACMLEELGVGRVLRIDDFNYDEISKQALELVKSAPTSKLEKIRKLIELFDGVEKLTALVRDMLKANVGQESRKVNAGDK